MTTARTDKLRDTVRALLPEAQALLLDLIRQPSLPGEETGAMEVLERGLQKLSGETRRVPMSDALLSDPDYSSPVPGIRYDGRYNLRYERQGRAGAPTLLLNAHLDVVPPSEGMERPFDPQVRDGVIYGRGACDDKGPLTAMYLALAALDKMGADAGCRVVAHFVVEEENGGNGSLAMVRTSDRGDACIVGEPTGGRVFTSIRGAVWFRVKFHGKAGHSGQAGKTRSALLLAREAMNALERYHAALLRESKGFALFDEYPNPMPITFGRLSAGNWPAAAPSEAILEGVLGFLPNRTKEQVMEEFRRTLLEDAGLSEADFDLTFTYRHDCSVVDPAHPLPKGLVDAAKAEGMRSEAAAFPASCDAWFYNNILGAPTVVFGPGDLAVAHSKDEQIAISEVEAAGAAIARFALEFDSIT